MRTLPVLTVGLLALGPSAGAGEVPAPVEFARDVQPILQRACAVCHNETLAQGGLSLASRAAALKGGESGPSITPGDAAGNTENIDDIAHRDISEWPVATTSH